MATYLDYVPRDIVNMTKQYNEPKVTFEKVNNSVVFVSITTEILRVAFTVYLLDLKCNGKLEALIKAAETNSKDEVTVNFNRSALVWRPLEMLYMQGQTCVYIGGELKLKLIVVLKELIVLMQKL